MLAENQVTELLCPHPDTLLKPDGDPGIDVLVVLGRADVAFAVFLKSTGAEQDHVGDAEACVDGDCYEIGKILPGPFVADCIFPLAVQLLAGAKHAPQLLICERYSLCSGAFVPSVPLFDPRRVDGNPPILNTKFKKSLQVGQVLS